MNLLQIAFSRQYIYSPKTLLHIIQPKHKIVGIFTYLSIIIYLDKIYINISILIYFIIFLLCKCSGNYFTVLIYLLLTIYVYIFFHTKILYLYNISEFFMRIIQISILHYLLLNILKFTTLIEDIIIFFLIYFKHNQYQNFKYIFFIISFASQCLEIIIKHINNIFISIKLKNIHYTNIYQIYYYALISFLKYIKNDIYAVSSILYSREINNINFRIDEV